MSSNYDPSRVFQVACPTCDAQPGEQCKTRNGLRRKKDDFHAKRKGVIYPEFATPRHGLSDPSRKAKRAVGAVEDYVTARLSLSQMRTSGERAEVEPKVEAARSELFDALKDGFTHGK